MSNQSLMTIGFLAVVVALLIVGWIAVSRTEQGRGDYDDSMQRFTDAARRAEDGIEWTLGAERRNIRDEVDDMVE